MKNGRYQILLWFISYSLAACNTSQLQNNEPAPQISQINPSHPDQNYAEQLKDIRERLNDNLPDSEKWVVDSTSNKIAFIRSTEIPCEPGISKVVLYNSSEVALTYKSGREITVVDLDTHSQTTKCEYIYLEFTLADSSYRGHLNSTFNLNDSIEYDVFHLTSLSVHQVDSLLDDWGIKPLEIPGLEFLKNGR